jgi:hypothetical protein
MIATAMRATMMPYSTAVAPSSSQPYFAFRYSSVCLIIVRPLLGLRFPV